MAATMSTCFPMRMVKSLFHLTKTAVKIPDFITTFTGKRRHRVSQIHLVQTLIQPGQGSGDQRVEIEGQQQDEPRQKHHQKSKCVCQCFFQPDLFFSERPNHLNKIDRFPLTSDRKPPFFRGFSVLFRGNCQEGAHPIRLEQSQSELLPASLLFQVRIGSPPRLDGDGPPVPSFPPPAHGGPVVGRDPFPDSLNHFHPEIEHTDKKQHKGQQKKEEWDLPLQLHPSSLSHANFVPHSPDGFNAIPPQFFSDIFDMYRHRIQISEFLSPKFFDTAVPLTRLDWDVWRERKGFETPLRTDPPFPHP